MLWFSHSSLFSDQVFHFDELSCDFRRKRTSFHFRVPTESCGIRYGHLEPPIFIFHTRGGCIRSRCCSRLKWNLTTAISKNFDRACLLSSHVCRRWAIAAIWRAGNKWEKRWPSRRSPGNPVWGVLAADHDGGLIIFLKLATVLGI